MSIIGTIHEDVTTDVVGKIGSWQWLVTFVTTVLMAPSVFNQYEDIFMIHHSQATCIPSYGFEVVNSSLCYVSNGTEVLKCHKWSMKLMWLIWLKKTDLPIKLGTCFQWLVFCDPHKRLLSTSIICRFGSMFGCVIYGFLADSFGRKKALTIDLFTSLGLGLIITFCDSEGWLRLLIFLKSVFGSASFYMGLLLICEISSNSWRGTLNTIVMTPRLFALACMVALANAAPNTETYSFVACLFGVVCIILLKWCPECPQWLLYNRQIYVAEYILKNAAKMNGIRLCSDFKIRPVNNRAYNCLDETASCVGVLTTHNVRIMVMILASFWIFYYFLWSCLYVKVYREEKVTDLVLKVVCCVGLFACLTVFVSKKLTLRSLVLMHVILTGALAACVIFLNIGMLRSICSAIAISSGVIVHALLLNITPRLFAVNIRATIFGCCHATGQFGSVLSYIILLFHPMDDVTYSAVIAAVTVTLSGLCLLLPDVDGRELPDVIEDMDYYSELTKPLRWACQKTTSPSTEEVEIRVYSFGSGRATHSSESRLPARRIGLATIRAAIANYLRNKVFRRK